MKKKQIQFWKSNIEKQNFFFDKQKYSHIVKVAEISFRQETID